MRVALQALTVSIVVAGVCAPVLAQDVPVARAQRLPSFAWYDPSMPIRWDGDYLRVSSGFSVTQFRKGPTIAGPTLGLDAGRMWQEGAWVYGVSAQADYMPRIAQITNSAAFPIVTRDLSGSVRVKLGYLVQPNLLLYTSVGATAFQDTWRMPAAAGGATDSRFAVRPDLRAGAQWAITNNLSLTLEVGVQPPLR